MEVLAQAIEVIKVTKEKTMWREGQDIRLEAVFSLRKVRRQGRSNQRKEECVARRKLF